MEYPLVGLRSSAVVLVLAATAALAAESLSRVPLSAKPVTGGLPVDIDELLAPLGADRTPQANEIHLRSDPLGAQRSAAASGTVAPRSGVPTVSSSGRRGRRLTAILISDDRSVAVIDEAVVLVGDRLPDGARVAEIRSDRVSVVEPNGQKRVLTLTLGRQ